MSQGQRHLLRARPVAGLDFGQQEARLEIGEPGGHHEIIGGEFEAQLPRRLDERQILVGKRQNRDLGEIHLLLARKHKQQVKRTLETLDVDNHRRLSRAAVGAEGGIEFLGAHDTVFRCDDVRSSPAICANIWRAACVSNSSGAERAASAASARTAESPERFGASAATASISRMSPLQGRTTSHPAASAARLRSAMVPDRAFIEMSSVISRPRNPIKPRITCLTIVTEVVAGATGSNALNTTCAVMPIGKLASARKAAKSVSSSVLRSVSTTGSLWWLSAFARP